jgi:hypothetical protein
MPSGSTGCDDGATAFARPKPTVPITTPGSVPTVAVGKWLAYTSDESGRREVYVQSFPTGGGKWQVSTSGGSDPRWRGDGRELFYFSQGKLVAVPISVGASFEAGVPVALFEANTGAHVFAVDPSGQRFLILAPLGKSAPPMTVLLDWTQGLPKE